MEVSKGGTKEKDGNGHVGNVRQLVTQLLNEKSGSKKLLMKLQEMVHSVWRIGCVECQDEDHEDDSSMLADPHGLEVAQ